MRYIFLIFLTFFIISCDSTSISRDTKIDFTKKAETLLDNRFRLKTYFKDFTKFEWDRVCFDDSDITTLTFKDTTSGSIYALSLPLNYHIEGSYAEGSPIRDTVLDDTPEANCWGKGSLFTIKKYIVNSKNHYLIQVGIEG